MGNAVVHAAPPGPSYTSTASSNYIVTRSYDQYV